MADEPVTQFYDAATFSEKFGLSQETMDLVSEHYIRAAILDRESKLVQACREGRTVVEFPHPAGDGWRERYELPRSLIRRWWWLRRAGYRFRRHGW